MGTGTGARKGIGVCPRNKNREAANTFRRDEGNSISQVEKDGERHQLPAFRFYAGQKGGLATVRFWATLGLACAPNLPPAPKSLLPDEGRFWGQADAPGKKRFAIMVKSLLRVNGV